MSVLFDILAIQVVASITKMIIDICTYDRYETEQILWYNTYITPLRIKNAQNWPHSEPINRPQVGGLYVQMCNNFQYRSRY